MAEINEELKRHLVRVKEDREKAGLKLNIQKINLTAFSPTILWQTEAEKLK